MRRGGADGVEDLAAGGPPADEVVPGSFPEQTKTSSAQLPAIRGWNSAARISCGFETFTPLLDPLGAVVDRPIFVRCPPAETGRRNGRSCFAFLEKAGVLARVMGCALLRRLVDCAGGRHQTGAGNAE